MNGVAAVSATALTVNYSHTVASWVEGYSSFNPVLTTALVFWGVFIAVMLVMRVILKYATELVKWERVHWFPQTVGLIFGGARGLWWAGFFLLVLTSSGFAYLKESAEQQSILGPRLLPTAHEVLERVVDTFPGAEGRGGRLIPPFKAEAPKAPARGRKS